MSDPDSLLTAAEPPTVDGTDATVAVVGAGALGATVAFDLVRAGAAVTLYDRDMPGNEASGRAAGVCYDAFADPLDAQLGQESIARFRRFASVIPFVDCPYLWFTQDGDTAATDRLYDAVERMQANGLAVTICEPATVAERFPALETADLAVAAVAEGAGYTDPVVYAQRLTTAAGEAGATLVFETPVSVQTDPVGVVSDGGSNTVFDAVVVTAGAHSGRLLADAGVELPMKPYRVQALTVCGPLKEPMWYDATDDRYGRPHVDGLLAGDGVVPREADPTAVDRTADSGFVDDMAHYLAHRFPDCSCAVERSWAGLCTATPDRDPLVGECRDGLFVATGFHGHGVMRAPAIGQRLARQVLGGGSLEAFDPTRFDGRDSFRIVDGLGTPPARRD